MKPHSPFRIRGWELTQIIQVRDDLFLGLLCVNFLECPLSFGSSCCSSGLGVLFWQSFLRPSLGPAFGLAFRFLIIPPPPDGITQARVYFLAIGLRVQDLDLDFV